MTKTMPRYSQTGHIGGAIQQYVYFVVIVPVFSVHVRISTRQFATAAHITQ